MFRNKEVVKGNETFYYKHLSVILKSLLKFLVSPETGLGCWENEIICLIKSAAAKGNIQREHQQEILCKEKWKKYKLKERENNLVIVIYKRKRQERIQNFIRRAI